MSNDNKTIEDAPAIVALNNDESSAQTIIERPQGEPTSGDGAGNDVQDHGPVRTVPFARSSFLHMSYNSLCGPM